MVILSHSGKQHSYHTAKALNSLGLLEKFFTSGYVRSGSAQEWLEKRGDQFWQRRYLPGLPGRLVYANWRFELPETILRGIFGKKAIVQKAVYRRDVHFDDYVANQIKRSGGRENIEKPLFWGFQGSCHKSLQAANAFGWGSACELATAHVVAAKRILGEEAKLQPEWASGIDNLVFPAAYEKRLEEEPHLAKKVIAASTFTKNTLLEAGIPLEKIVLLPLGFDLDHIRYQEEKEISYRKRPLRLLFAGTVTQRKGISYLLEALRKLNSRDVELHIIGGVQGSTDPLKPNSDLYIYHGSMSQPELFKKYCEYDVLVLPTVFEGFGLVIVEAMAAGLPVITTPHSMGPEVISQGENGYIVPIRDTDALVDAISQLLDKTPEDFELMRKSARKAALSFSWENYAWRLGEVLSTGRLYS